MTLLCVAPPRQSGGTIQIEITSNERRAVFVGQLRLLADRIEAGLPVGLESVVNALRYLRMLALQGRA